MLLCAHTEYLKDEFLISSQSNVTISLVTWFYSLDEKHCGS